MEARACRTARASCPAQAGVIPKREARAPTLAQSLLTGSDRQARRGSRISVARRSPRLACARGGVLGTLAKYTHARRAHWRAHGARALFGRQRLVLTEDSREWHKALKDNAFPPPTALRRHPAAKHNARRAGAHRVQLFFERDSGIGARNLAALQRRDDC